MEKLRQTSPRSLWLTDLDALENELDVRNAAVSCSGYCLVHGFLTHLL